MAGKSLGVLTLDLVARIGGYEQGLAKAEREAQKRAKAIERAFDGAVLGIKAGMLAIGAATLAAVVGFDKLVGQAGDFQDMAEKIGGSAEGIASFAVAAGTAGTSMETVVGASVRLTKGLTGVDDESKAAGAAIVALGLDLQDFKKLSPERQIEAVAKALAGFEDGAQKTAVAVALFGKSGAELLPFLKALEEQGGRQVILTAEQIRQADEYSDGLAKIKTEINLQAQALSTQLIPTMTAALGVVLDIGKAFVNSDAAALAFNVAIGVLVTTFQTAAILGANVAFVFSTVGKELGSIVAQMGAFARGDFDQIRVIRDAVREDTAAARAELDAFEKRVMAVGSSVGLDDEARRRLGRGAARPSLAFNGAAAKDKKTADPQAEAKRYLESLQKQLEKTEDLTVAEQVLKDIQSGRLGIVSEEIQKSLLLTAQQIDAAKALTEEIKLRREAVTAEGDAITKSNEAYQKRLELLLDNTPSAVLEKQRADVRLLTDEFEAGHISEQEYTEAVTARLDLVGEKIKETKSFAEEFGLTFTSALEDAIVTGGKFSDMLKAVGQDILRLIVRQSITEPLFKSITSSGALGGISDFFSGLFSFDGGGYTGNGARSGGLDGKGGYMAMVHPQETIVDHTRGQGGGVTIGSVGAGVSRSEMIAAVQTARALSAGDRVESQRRRGM